MSEVASVPCRLLIVKLSSLGDLFHALPAVHNLKKGLKGEIDWVTQTEYVDLVRCFTDVSQVIAFPRRQPSRALGFIRTLRLKRYDYVIDLQGLLKSAAVTRLARGRRKIGPSFHREGAGILYSEIAGTRALTRHAVAQNLDVVSYLNIQFREIAFPVAFQPETLSQARPRIALLPLSRWPTKNWPVEHFISLGRLLRARRSVSLFLLGGTKDAGKCQEIERALGGNVVNLAGRLSIPETGAVLREMDLLIAGDSGPIHMSAAVGTPTLAIFGPTDPVRTGPYGDQHRVLRSNLPCQPCYARRCRRGDNACMREIFPEQVAETALDMLK